MSTFQRAGFWSVPAAAAIVALAVLAVGAPVALAGDSSPREPRAEVVLPRGSHAHRPLETPDDQPAQVTPTPDDEIPDVSLTLGDASHTVDVAGYFTDSVNGYAVSASPGDIVHTSRSGTVITIEPIAVGSTTVTVTGMKFGTDERKRFTVTVSAMVSAPTATGSIDGVTLTEGATHDEDASEYFEGEGVTYTAESSDDGVATVEVAGLTVTVTAVAAGSATVTVTATNTAGSAEQAFAVTVLPPAPATVGSIEAATLTEGGTHEVIASDHFEGEGVTYTAESSDDGVATVEVAGLTVTVTAVAAGSATVTVTATNTAGSAEQAFAVTVLPPAPATVGSIEAATLTEGGTHEVIASDHFEGEGVTYTAASSDSEVASVAVSGAAVTVTAVGAGSATVTVTATNTAGSAEQSFAVTVLPPVPSAPTAVGSIEAATISEGGTHEVIASDYFAGEGVTYAAESSDSEVATVEVNGAAVTVTAVAAGSATVTVTATNAGGSAEQSFAVTVLPPVPSAPTAVGSIEAATITEGGTHEVIASDYFSGEGVTYGVESSDTGVATVAVSGAAVTVTAVAVGSATVTVTATNSGGSAEQSFAVTVLPPAPTAVGSIEAATLAEGETHGVTASDYFSGEGVTYGAASSDAAVASVAVDGAAVTVTAVAAGSATVTVTATNAGGNADQSFAVTVLPPAPAAVGSIEAATISEGGTHEVAASDYFSGEGVAYGAESSGSEVASVAVSGEAVTVTAVAAGGATVTVTATNAGGSAEQSFAVTVLPPAPATVGSIEAATITEGGTHEVAASDYFSGEGVTYGAASSDAAVVSVEVSGAAVTVTAVAAGSAIVTVTATNSGGSAEQSFVVTVLPPAPAAVGSIEAATISEGATHTVTASDHFSGEGVTYAAGSSDATVASVEVNGAAVTVTAVAAGSATVTMTATNTGGSAEQPFAVTVLPLAPTAVGSISALTLPEREAHLVTASDYFVGESVTYEAESSDSAVAAVAVDGATVTVTAVAVGEATVTITATNAGGEAEQAFAVTVLPSAPTAVGSIEAATITEGETHGVTASDYFAGEGVTYGAGSSDSEVASVAVDGAAVTVTAVAAGSATVTVTATNAGGSAEQSFVVTVQLPPVTLTLGGAAQVIELSDQFGSGITGYDVSVSPAGVVEASTSGSQLTLKALAVGAATVTLGVTSAGDRAEHQFAVSVTPPAPTPTGSVSALTLSEREAHVVTASDYFEGEGVTYGAESSDAGVATVAVSGAVVTVTAVAVGEATVTITATNAGGDAEQRFAVTVQLPAVRLVKGGAGQGIELADYFGDEVTGYEVAVSPSGIVHVSRSGSQLTLTGVAAGSATVTVTATSAGGSAEQSFAVTVLPPAPTTVGSIEAATISEGGTHEVAASDYFSGEGVTYAAGSSDAAVATVAVSGAAVTVTAVAVGSATVTVTATNSGGSAEQSFAVTVLPPAPTTVGSIEAATISEGGTHEVAASDYFSGEGVTYAAESSDAAVATVAVSGAAVTVTAVAVGSATVTVTATNTGGSAEQSFAVTVLPPVPSAPTAISSIEAATITEGETHLVTASGYFAGEGVTYGAESSDSEVASAEVSGAAVTVTAVAVGSATVTVTATNTGGSAEQSFAVTVLPPVPSAPTAISSIEAATITEGETHLVTASGYFAGEGVTYGAESSDSEVASAEVSGAAVTVTAVAAGSATVTVTATNTAGSAEQTFAVTVVPPAPAAVGSIEAATISEGATHTVTASEYFEGEGVTYGAESSDAGVASVEVGGAAVTVTAVAAGSATVTVTATSAGGSAEQSFAVTVLPPAPAMVGSIEAATIAEGGTHSVTASDHFSGEGVTYGAESSDAGVASVEVGGAAVTVTAVAAGSATVTVTATNSGGSAEQSFAVTVLPSAPTAVGSIEAATLAEGATHTVTASGYFSGEEVTYGAASSDGEVATVAVSGAAVTVTAVAAGSATVTVTATNAGGSAEQSFAVTVLPPAPAAIGSIEAATISEGATHMVTASDHFSGGGATYGAESSDDGVAAVEVDSAAVTVTALAAGSATVTVTATNAGGSAEQSFAVTVQLPRVTLTLGGAAQVIELSDQFGSGVTGYDVSVSPAGVVEASTSGSQLTLKALAVGAATVTLGVTSAGDRAEHQFAVSVTPPAPTPTGSVSALTLSEREAHVVTASDYFEGEGVTYGAESSDAGVASVEVDGAAVTVTAAAFGSATVTVTATNTGGSAEQSFAVTVLPPAPATVGSIEAATITEGGTHLVTASEYFEGEGIRYAAASSDAGVASVVVDGAAVTVTAVATGSATVTVTATNSGGSAEQSFAVTVLPSAPATVGSIEAATITEGGTHEVAASEYFSGEGVAYGAESSDAGVASVEVNGAVVTVTAVAAGSATVTVTATNAGGSAEQSFAVTVLPPAPVTVGSIEAATITEGATHTVTASDHFSGDGAMYTAESSDAGVASVEVDGAAVTVTALAAGSATVTVTATNAGGSAEQSFAVTVLPPAPTAVGSIEAATITGGETHLVTASEYFEGVGVTYGAESSDSEVASVAVDGAVVTVTAVAAGSATVTVTATNAGGSAEQSFAVTVLPSAPTTVGSIEAATISEGGTHSVTASEYFSGEGVTYGAESSDSVVASVEVSGAAVTVTAVAAGSATVTVTATNTGGSAEQSFAVTVVPPAPVTVGSTLSLTLTEGGDAHEIDLAHSFSGSVERYGVAATPGGIVHLWESGGRLTVTPLAAGEAVVTVAATNAGGSTESIFSVTVKSRSPRALGVIPLTRIIEGDIHLVEAAAHFDAEGATYAAQSSDSGVATVEVYGDVVAVTAVDAGFTRITLTATDGIRSAQQDILVIVLPRAPKVLGSVADVALAEGETAPEIRLADYLDGKLVSYQVTAVPGGVVHVWESGGRLRLTALAAGTATVTVRAVNGSGSAGLSFEVTVRPQAPNALAGSQALTLTVGAEAEEIELADHFSGMVVRYEVQAVPGGVVHVWESGGRLTITPLSPGLARITVTAANGSGSAEQDILVTVAPAAPVVLGAISDAALIEGGAEHEIALADYFSGVIARYEAAAAPDDVVHVWESGGGLRLAPLAAGVATVTVTAANVSASAEQVFAVAVAPAGPKTLGSIEGVTLNEGSEGWELELADYFGGAVARYEAAAVPDGVVHVWESGGRLRLAPLAAGVAMVNVTAANDSGSAGQVVAVTVIEPAPRALGSIERVTLSEGGEAREAELADYFGGTVTHYGVSAVPAGVVHLWESGGRLALTPLAAGTATVTVTASNAAGSAGQVVVVAVAPAAPRALGSIEGVTLVEGGAARELDLDDYFAGEVAGYDVTTVPVTTVPGAIVHLWEADGRLWLTPLVAGAATVTVTASNTAGSAEQAVPVTVAPAAPRALGRIEGVTLAEGGEALAFDLTDYFGGVVARYEVSADPGGVVHVWESDRRLALTPLAAGVATVTVTALNGSGSATQEFAVTVDPRAVDTP